MTRFYSRAYCIGEAPTQRRVYGLFLELNYLLSTEYCDYYWYDYYITIATTMIMMIQFYL